MTKRVTLNLRSLMRGRVPAPLHQPKSLWNADNFLASVAHAKENGMEAVCRIPEKDD